MTNFWTEIEAAAPNSNPVARWVESVQPWMPGSDDDDVMRDAGDTPDWTARSRGCAATFIIIMFPLANA